MKEAMRFGVARLYSMKQAKGQRPLFIRSSGGPSARQGFMALWRCSWITKSSAAPLVFLHPGKRSAWRTAASLAAEAFGTVSLF